MHHADRYRAPRGEVDRDDWVSASEIAGYTYCARAYWLEHVHGAARPAAKDEARLGSGVLHHEAHGRRVKWQRRFLRIAIALLAAAGILLVARRVGHPPSLIEARPSMGTS